MILIGIHGKGGSGKDTVGEILRDNHGFGITAFATPIKVMICGLLDVPMSFWDNRVWREAPIPEYNNRSPRFMAQTIGTEWGRRTIGPDLWLSLAMNKINNIGWPKVAITDVRFENEADYIRAHGGFIIVVHRGESDLHVDAQQHASEIGLQSEQKGDLHINNYGTLADLEAQVAVAVEQIFVEEEERELEKIQSDAVDPAGTGD